MNCRVLFYICNCHIFLITSEWDNNKGYYHPDFYETVATYEYDEKVEKLQNIGDAML